MINRDKCNKQCVDSTAASLCEYSYIPHVFLPSVKSEKSSVLGEFGVKKSLEKRAWWWVCLLCLVVN